MPLNETVNIILKEVHEEEKTSKGISRSVTKEVLYICTEHMPLTFSGKIYIQFNGVIMGSPLESFLENIFTSVLEKNNLC